MGATQSKTSEPVIFYNQSSPLQVHSNSTFEYNCSFKCAFFSSLNLLLLTTKRYYRQKDSPCLEYVLTRLQTVNLESNEKIEELVRERVAEELKRVQYQNEAVNQQNYGELAKKNIENDHNSVAMTEDIEGMIKKLQRYSNI